MKHAQAVAVTLVGSLTGRILYITVLLPDCVWKKKISYLSSLFYVTAVWTLVKILYNQNYNQWTTCLFCLSSLGFWVSLQTQLSAQQAQEVHEQIGHVLLVGARKYCPFSLFFSLSKSGYRGQVMGKHAPVQTFGPNRLELMLTSDWLTQQTFYCGPPAHPCCRRRWRRREWHPRLWLCCSSAMLHCTRQ